MPLPKKCEGRVGRNWSEVVAFFTMLDQYCFWEVDEQAHLSRGTKPSDDIAQAGRRDHGVLLARGKGHLRAKTRYAAECHVKNPPLAPFLGTATSDGDSVADLGNNRILEETPTLPRELASLTEQAAELQPAVPC